MKHRIRSTFLACILLLAGAESAFARLPDLPLACTDPMLRLASATENWGRSALLVGADDFGVILDFSGDLQELRALGVTTRSQLGTMITCSVPPDRLNAVAALPGMKSLRLGRQFQTMLDVSVPDTHAASVRSGVPPNWTCYTGKGVVIGAVDRGIDVIHPDFRDASGNSRILFIWDQTTGVSGANHPPPYNYGTEWTKADIDAGFCTQLDVGGHGTSVASIAAGNGAATGNGWPAYRYVGMAPEADLIIVKSTLTGDAIIDGMNYIRNKSIALGKPCSINLSIGTQISPHDGTDPVERAIDQISGPGVVVCTATGNSGTTDPARYVHAAWTVPAKNSLVTAGLNVTATRASPFYMDIWYEGSDFIDITLTSPNGFSVTKQTGQSTGGYQTTADGDIWIDNASGGADPYNGDRECLVVVQNAACGQWSVTATGRTIVSGGACDAWIEAGQNVFWSSYGTNSGSCTVPGTSNSAIVVGGYISKLRWYNPDGTLQGWGGTPGVFYTTSGLGPTRDGRQRPELCVPSSRIACALSSNYAADPINIVEDGVHVVQGGTSMAAPHMTGAVAIFLQRDPTATASDIKAIVLSTARGDSYTGDVPNECWGAGKLDVSAAVSQVALYTDVGTARVQPDGTAVKLPAQIVTAGLSQFSDRFYIESPDRCAGIQVRSGVASGIQAEEAAKVTVHGIVETADGERAILSPVVTNLGWGTVPRPLFMLLRSAGGDDLSGLVPGVAGGCGLNNVGLLVRVCGRVISLGTSSFVIEDGSSSQIGVRCGALSKPALGQFVVATGIVVVDWDGYTAVPVVRARKQSDLDYH